MARSGKSTAGRRVFGLTRGGVARRTQGRRCRFRDAAREPEQRVRPGFAVTANAKRKRTASFEYPIGAADDVFPGVVRALRHRVDRAGLTRSAMLVKRGDGHADRPALTRHETDIRGSIRSSDAHVHLELAHAVVARNGRGDERPILRLFEAFPPLHAIRPRRRDRR